MDHKIALSIVSRLFFSLALVITIAGLGATQSERNKPVQQQTNTMRPDISAKRHPDSTYEGTGWLIHNGRLIPGPYDVVVHDSSITINGLHICPKLRPEPRDTAEIDSLMLKRHELSRKFWGIFEDWVENKGRDSAYKLAVKYMLAQPIVDTAYMASSENMYVNYIHRPERGILFGLGPKIEFSPQPEGWQRELYVKRARELRYYLTHRGLVFSQNGKIRKIRPPMAELKLARIRELVNSITDFQERVVAIREVAIDREMAEAIAKRFNRK